jgi:hypothetical protein
MPLKNSKIKVFKNETAILLHLISLGHFVSIQGVSKRALQI